MKYLFPFAVALLVSTSFARAGEKEHDHMTMDGQSHPQDMSAMSADEFAKLDADKNGQLDRAEVPKDHRLAAHFDMLDTDKSGTLSLAEFAKGSM